MWLGVTMSDLNKVSQRMKNVLKLFNMKRVSPRPVSPSFCFWPRCGLELHQFTGEEDVFWCVSIFIFKWVCMGFCIRSCRITPLKKINFTYLMVQRSFSPQWKARKIQWGRFVCFTMKISFILLSHWGINIFYFYNVHFHRGFTYNG